MSDFNVSDWLVSSNKSLSKRAMLNDTSMGSPNTMFQRAVVYEVLYDLSVIEKDYYKQLLKRTSNSSFLPSAPPGSILVKIVEGGEAQIDPDLMLLYPLFPPHVRFPIKAGEYVWVFDPTPTEITDLAYWVCRVTTADFTDDINFTHFDRQFAESSHPMPPKTRPAQPGFPNGDPSEVTNRTLGDPDGYEQIYTGSLANQTATTFEPVPRFKVAPGDLALQGSNNTLICLGQDRGYTSDAPAKTDKASRSPGSNMSNASMSKSAKEQVGKGTIDIVTGRGQTDGTKAKEITNDRAYTETNKNPINYGDEKSSAGDTPLEDGAIPDDENCLINPAEGDPDFVNDLSRVYISMRTKGDPNLGLTYPDWAGAAVGDPSPYVIAKSDEIRLVGRQSVRIISETGESLMTILPDNKIAIHSKKIMIGDGTASQTYIGDKDQTETSPLCLGDLVQKQLDDTHQKIMEHCEAMKTIDPIGCLFGWAPLQVFQITPGTVPDQWVTHKGAISGVKAKNPTIKSKVAFVNPDKHH